MTVFDNPNLLNIIHSNFVFIGLNASEHAERKDGYTGSWRMFHSDDNERQRDYKLRYALVGTQYEGSYMTDIIKNHPDKNSREVEKFCKANPEVITENIEILKEELKILGGKPVLIAMGDTVYNYLTSSDIKEDYQIIKITHYSYRAKNKESLREEVLRTLR